MKIAGDYLQYITHSWSMICEGSSVKLSLLSRLERGLNPYLPHMRMRDRNVSNNSMLQISI